VLSTLRLSIPYKQWEIILTESDTRPLRFEVIFELMTEYELVISFEDAIDKILKKIGMREVEVNDEPFDKQFLIHSNDPDLTRKLLTSDIREKILRYNLYNISYQTDKKAKKSGLTSVVSRTLTDREAYLDLVDLHKLMIDSLLELGVV
jgi:hypothetical protein